MQLFDFKAIINEHPEIKERLDNDIQVNYTALVQHYGITTNMLDLTNSPLVASFFATEECVFKVSSPSTSIPDLQNDLEQKGYRFFSNQPFAYTAEEKDYLLAETKRMFPDFG